MGKAKGRKAKRSKKKPADSYESAIEQAHAYLARFEYVQACELLQDAVRMRPDDTESLDMLGDVLLTYIGDEERGSAALQHSIHIAPDEGHVKYLSLGQLRGGHEGLALYQKGVENLMRAISVAQDEEQAAELRCNAAQAYCAVAELWQTDLCMEDCAEAQCEQAIQAALHLAPEDVEANYLLAQHRLRENRLDECRHTLNRTCELLSMCDEDRLPSLEIRVEIAKVLVQVDLWPVAFGVLKSILKEDDGNGFVWYLLSECSRRLGKPRRAMRHLVKAKGIAMRLVAGQTEADIAQGDGGPAEFLQQVGGLEAQIVSDLGGPAAAAAAAAEEEAAGFVTDSDDDDQDGDDDDMP
eukprot:TRINITY_DN1996_c0_g1_i4.p1 TRINITY_DN1996_c0_g1~~TRINITY_DN1996_c0_g1_i4.p1  ORF type:complete len:373 (+),score=98.98 TRINITY_DN1996_c0_g1_i4:58-1119(+)